MVTKVSDTVVDTAMESQFRYLHYKSSGLNFVISEGILVEDVGDGGPVTYPEQTLVLTDNSVNYIYLDFSNTPATLEVSATAPILDAMLIHQPVASGGVVTSNVDYRWKQPNNRFIQDPFWPSVEDELILFKHRQSISPSGTIIIRGLDTPYQRNSFVFHTKQADLRLSSGSSTTGADAYGFWRSLSPAKDRMIQQRNVNGSASVPFVAFERDSAGMNSDVDWVALGAVPQMINDASTPTTSQLFYADYNPVYLDVIVGGSAGGQWWVYDDNDDGTYSVNRPADSFDTLPAGNGARGRYSARFTDDGEVWCQSQAGGARIEFYDRSLAGARYQLVNADTTKSGSYNSAIVYWDEANQEFLVKTQSADPENMTGYRFGGSTWDEEYEEDIVSNADWEATLPASVSSESMWVDSTGSDMLLATQTASGSLGLHHFTRRAAPGGWDWDDSFQLLDGDGVDIIVADLNFSTIASLGNDYIYICHGESVTDGYDRIYHYSNGAFRHVMDMGPGNSSSQTQAPFGGPAVSGQILVTKNGTLNDPTDAIINPYDPLWWISPYCNMGSANFDYRKFIYGWDNGDAGDFQKWYIWNNDSSIAGPTAAVGPLANTAAMEVVSGQQDIEFVAGSFDIEDYLSNTSQIVPTTGMQGSWVIVWKTPVAWPVATDTDTVLRPLLALGHVGAWPNTQPTQALGVGVQSAGATAHLRWGSAKDNGGGEAFIAGSDTNLALDTWYITAVTQDGAGFKVYNNNVLQTMDELSPTVYNWPGGHYAWTSATTTITKAGQIGSHSAVAGSELPGALIHVIAMWDSALNPSVLARLQSDYGI